MATNKKEVKYLNKDFSQFRQNLIEFSKIYFPNTYNDFNESSPGMMFMEMASYVGDVLSYYGDYQLKESFLSNADNTADVLALAANIGYHTKNKIPAIVDLDVFQLLPADANGDPDWSYALILDSNMLIGSDTSDSTQFYTTNLVNFKVSSSFDPTELSVYQIDTNTNAVEYYLLKKTIKAVAGKVNTVAYSFGAAKRFDKILIDSTDCMEVLSITDSDLNDWLEVPYLAQNFVYEAIPNIVQNDPELSQYTDVPYLLKIKKTARRFVKRFRSDKKLEIQFGAGITDISDEEIIPNPDNVGSELNGLQVQFDFPIDSSNFLYTKSYGLAPSNTTLTVKYTTGGGITSNVPANTLTKIISVNYTIDSQNLDSVLLNRIKASVAVNNPAPATGGKNAETIEEIRQNAMAFFGAQQRSVTDQDYMIRAYSMPSKFGAVAKAYVMQDQAINTDYTNITNPNPLAINLYTLGFDYNNTLTQLNPAVKENLKTYINSYRILTDAVNIRDAYIINIGIAFDVITLPDYNSYEVILKCVNRLKELFDIQYWKINQPIVMSKLYTELDRVDGVQSIPAIRINNLYDSSLGYSGNIYDIAAATKNGVIYPSLDPSIFEVKYPNTDIVGRVVSI